MLPDKNSQFIKSSWSFVIVNEILFHFYLSQKLTSHTWETIYIEKWISIWGFPINFFFFFSITRIYNQRGLAVCGHWSSEIPMMQNKISKREKESEREKPVQWRNRSIIYIHIHMVVVSYYEKTKTWSWRKWRYT